MFTLEECSLAIQSGNPFVYCCGIPSRMVRIDRYFSLSFLFLFSLSFFFISFSHSFSFSLSSFSLFRMAPDIALTCVDVIDKKYLRVDQKIGQGGFSLSFSFIDLSLFLNFLFFQGVELFTKDFFLLQLIETLQSKNFTGKKNKIKILRKRGENDF